MAMTMALNRLPVSPGQQMAVSPRRRRGYPSLSDILFAKQPAYVASVPAGTEARMTEAGLAATAKRAEEGRDLAKTQGATSTAIGGLSTVAQGALVAKEMGWIGGGTVKAATPPSLAKVTAGGTTAGAGGAGGLSAPIAGGTAMAAPTGTAIGAAGGAEALPAAAPVAGGTVAGASMTGAGVGFGVGYGVGRMTKSKAAGAAAGGISGAVAGGLMGAKAGSAGGYWGAGIGAVVGIIGGLIGGSKEG